MSIAALETTIEAAFEARDTISTATRGEVRDAVNEALNLLDAGKARVATKGEDGNWVVHQWLKKAVLLSFRLTDNSIIPYTSADGSMANGFDKVDLKYAGWGETSSAPPVSVRSRALSCAVRHSSPRALC
jgi:2,3,4,5-tetrahydropyridine-2,6-dicarboxylate N-succinyltransferase